MKEAGVPQDVADEALEQYGASQIDGLSAALAVLAVIGVIALFFTGRIPEAPTGFGAGAGVTRGA